MSLTVPALRQRVAAAVEAVSSPLALAESRFGWSLFGRSADPALHGAFAVGCPLTTPKTDRQKVSLGGYFQTTVSVRFAHRLRPDAQVADYDAALAVEASIVAAVMGMSLANVHIRWDGEPARATSPEGDWYLGDLRFLADHLYALQ